CSRGRIAWQEEEGKGDPWNVNRLTLYCSVDTRLWTTEGTNQVREEKAEEIAKTITNTKAKGNLKEEQQAIDSHTEVSTLLPARGGLKELVHSPGEIAEFGEVSTPLPARGGLKDLSSLAA
ncbi:MAG: hypothetical protein ACYT04_81795, partial [Nostoc sp.]